MEKCLNRIKFMVVTIIMCLLITAPVMAAEKSLYAEFQNNVESILEVELKKQYDYFGEIDESKYEYDVEEVCEDMLQMTDELIVELEKEDENKEVAQEKRLAKQTKIIREYKEEIKDIYQDDRLEYFTLIKLYYLSESLVTDMYANKYSNISKKTYDAAIKAEIINQTNMYKIVSYLKFDSQKVGNATDECIFDSFNLLPEVKKIVTSNQGDSLNNYFEESIPGRVYRYQVGKKVYIFNYDKMIEMNKLLSKEKDKKLTEREKNVVNCAKELAQSMEVDYNQWKNTLINVVLMGENKEEKVVVGMIYVSSGECRILYYSYEDNKVTWV